VALRTSRSARDGALNLPIGKPRKMVKPAIAPSIATFVDVIGTLSASMAA
jgi:hypothetical protein